MLRVRTWFLLLVVCAGSSQAWFWNPDPETTTETSLETTAAGTTGATPTPGGTKKEQEEDDNLSGVGEEIINVATGIRKFVEAWDVTPTTGTTNGGLTEEVESANLDTTGNAARVRGARVEEGSGEGSGADLESASVLKVLPSNLTGIIDDVSKINVTLEGVLDSTLTPPDSRTNGSDPACLPVPSDWPICSGKRPKFFTLPNIFNHTSVEEVGAALQEWVRLTRAGCHHGTEWFLCLLLVPRCSSLVMPAHLPCRSFCHVLRDSCWASLENGRLPLECHLLPERAQGPGYPPCVSVSNWKGNLGG